MLHSVSTHKCDRFILPLFPFIAIMISAWVLSFTRLKKLLVSILVFFSFIQYFFISYVDVFLPDENNLYKKYFPRKFDSNLGLLSKETDRRWEKPVERMTKIIKNNTNEEKINLLFLSDHQYLIWEIIYRLMLQNRDSRIEVFGLSCGTEVSNVTNSELNRRCSNNMASSDIIIVESKKVCEEFPSRHGREMYKCFRQIIDEIEYLGKVEFSHNFLKFDVYKRK